MLKENFTNKNFSELEKYILIKAIPRYIMNIFKLSQCFYDGLNKLHREFSHCKEKCINWISYDKMCSANVLGGLSFGDLVNFNLVLLAKQY